MNNEQPTTNSNSRQLIFVRLKDKALKMTCGRRKVAAAKFTLKAALAKNTKPAKAPRPRRARR